MVKISVIIPVYNAETFIDNCLNSLEKQTFKDFEVILVDDGSKDNSLKKCKEFKKKSKLSVKVVAKINGGPSSARNCGLDNANSEFVCFIDSDDLVQKDYLKNMYKARADWVITGYTERTDTNDILIIPKLCGTFTENEDHSKNLIYNLNAQIYNPPYNKLYKLSIIRDNNLKFDESLKMGEDFKFNISYFKHCKKLQVIDSCEYIYNHINENALTNKFNDNRWDIEKSLYEIYREYFIENNTYEKFKYLINEFLIISLNKTIYTLLKTTRSKKEKLLYIKECFDDKIFKGNKIKVLRFKNKIVYCLVKLKMYRVMYLLTKYKIKSNN